MASTVSTLPNADQPFLVGPSRPHAQAVPKAKPPQLFAPTNPIMDLGEAATTSWAQQMADSHRRDEESPYPEIGPDGLCYSLEDQIQEHMLWNDPCFMEKLLLAIACECKAARFEIPWDRIAERIEPGTKGKHIINRFPQIRNHLLMRYEVVPPAEIVQNLGRINIHPSDINDYIAFRGEQLDYIDPQLNMTLRHILWCGRHVPADLYQAPSQGQGMNMCSHAPYEAKNDNPKNNRAAAKKRRRNKKAKQRRRARRDKALSSRAQSRPS